MIRSNSIPFTFAILAIAAFSLAANASENCDRRTTIVGAAASELYASLNLPETPVESSDNSRASALLKTGKFISCEKFLADGRAQCLIVEPFTGVNCD